MSLIRPMEFSATPHPNHKLYSLNGVHEDSSMSSHVFGSDKSRTMYMTDAYSIESYEKYFVDSPNDELLQPSSSSISGNCQFSSELDYSEFQTPDLVDYDVDNMRIKLQELERALLEENEEIDDMIINNQGIEIDGEWMMLQDSPKESTSSDTYLSSIGSTKEVSQLSPRTPKRLLFDCANAIAQANFEVAEALISELRQMVSIQGEPMQRIAAYMVEGLVARMASSGEYIYRALNCKEPPSSDRLAGMQILFEICPCFKFGFMAANRAIIEAFKGEKRVHLIDFDINQGNQYINLIQSLANIPGKLPQLRLTGIDDPASVQRQTGGLHIIGQRLEKLAEMLKVPFKFHPVASKASLVSPALLGCKPGEALIVNFAFQLHHMPDESVSTVNERDQLLRMVKSLNPKLVTLVEQDVNANTAPFLTRFAEAYDYYSAVFESLDATLPRESQDRMNVEKQCLARDIVNIVACEGVARIERYEVAGKWRARMMMAGFSSRSMGPNVVNMIREVIVKQYCDRYKMKEEMGSLLFGWEDKNLILASAWR